MMTSPLVRTGCLLAALSLGTFAPPASAATCPPAGWTVAQLAELKQAKFALADDARRQVLAVGLLDCLESRDPALRDRLAFEALSAWMRAGKLQPATLATIRDRLSARLEATGPDPDGVGKPFAALVLSEVARTDLVAPWLTPAERNGLVEASARYMEGITDHRGYDEIVGWRHAVAHDADLMMQLARNPALEKPQLDRLLAAIATQVAPADGHAYIHGEPARLVRPVMFIAARGLLTDEERKTWLARVADPAPMKTWADAFESAEGLARHHDLHAFLLELHLAGMNSKNPGQKAMSDAALAALNSGQ